MPGTTKSLLAAALTLPLLVFVGVVLVAPDGPGSDRSRPVIIGQVDDGADGPDAGRERDSRRGDVRNRPGRGDRDDRDDDRGGDRGDRGDGDRDDSGDPPPAAPTREPTTVVTPAPQDLDDDDDGGVGDDDDDDDDGDRDDDRGPAPQGAPARGRRPGRTIPVRIRIAATIAVVTAAAMAAAGLLVYVLESSRIDNNLNQQISQEIDELRALQDGDDPATTRPFASVERLLNLYLVRNVTDDDEMLVRYVEGRSPRHTPNRYGQAILEEREYLTVVDRLMGSGGTEVYDSPTYQEVWVTLVPVENRRDLSGTGALVIVNFAYDERGELNRTIQTYALLTLLFLGLITLLAIWRSGQLLAPLTDLRRTAEEIGETDLSRRIPERGNDDITALTRTVNDMLARLEHAFVGQRQFLDDAGHELKTPLTILRGHLEVLDVADPGEVAETRLLLLDEIDRMSRLVGELILLAKSDRPDFVTSAPVSLERLTHTLLAKARGLADRRWELDAPRRRSWRSTSSGSPRRCCSSPTTRSSTPPSATRSPSGPRSRAGWPGSGCATTGPGCRSDREHVFERFGRSVLRAADEGFGLGLSIVRRSSRPTRAGSSWMPTTPPARAS